MLVNWHEKRWKERKKCYMWKGLFLPFDESEEAKSVDFVSDMRTEKLIFCYQLKATVATMMMMILRQTDWMCITRENNFPSFRFALCTSSGRRKVVQKANSGGKWKTLPTLKQKQKFSFALEFIKILNHHHSYVEILPVLSWERIGRLNENLSPNFERNMGKKH